jgi:hypothetical protein
LLIFARIEESQFTSQAVRDDVVRRKETVCEGCLAVVDMGDDGDILEIYEPSSGSG